MDIRYLGHFEPSAADVEHETKARVVVLAPGEAHSA